ncbi:MAG: hypothetical protein IK025_01940 [Bacteroidales bacterium]|nr:hypothetical protein [Bacteroidales bacterium]
MSKHILTILLLFISTFAVAQSNTETFTDKRDGNTYNIITIGTQKWMGENLRFLPKVKNADWGNEIDAFYYVYGNNTSKTKVAKSSANYATYGVLYNWAATKNACPTGWRLPSNEDWEKLEKAIGEKQLGSALASKSENWAKGELRKSERWGKSGFNAYPAGYRDGNCFYADEGTSTYFWTSEQTSDGYSYYRYIDSKETYFGLDHGSWENGYSIRCVKD